MASQALALAFGGFQCVLYSHTVGLEELVELKAATHGATGRRQPY